MRGNGTARVEEGLPLVAVWWHVLKARTRVKEVVMRETEMDRVAGVMIVEAAVEKVTVE